MSGVETGKTCFFSGFLGVFSLVSLCIIYLEHVRTFGKIFSVYIVLKVIITLWSYEMNPINCQVCAHFFTTSISEMVSHLVLVHQNDPGLHIICDVPGCISTFSRVFSYKSHLRRSHKDIDIKKPVAQIIPNVQGLNAAEERLDSFQGNVISPQNEDDTEEMKRTSALYLMKLKETNFLTQTSLDNVVQGTTAIVKRTVKVLKKEVAKKLEGGGLELTQIEGLSNIFDEDHPLSNPLDHVATKHQQTVFQKTNFSLVVSTIVI